MPKWTSDRSVNNYGEPGDLIMLRCRSDPGEQIVVGAYLYYKTIRNEGDQWIDTSNWQPAKVSEIGRQWGYLSKSLKSVGIWTRFTNSSNDKRDDNIQLFLPYSAVGLANGDYRLRYRVRVWANGSVIDDYYSDEQRVSQIRDGDQYRELLAICAGVDGPSLCDFQLKEVAD